MISDKIYGEVKSYCEYNGIDDVNGFLDELVLVGLNIKKYGVKPQVKPQIINKEDNLVVEDEVSDDIESDIYGE